MNSIFRMRIGQSLAALALLVAGLVLNSASAAAPVKLAVVNWIGYGPIYVAAAKGFFDAEGVPVKLITFSDNAAMPTALAGGAVDAATLTYDQVIDADAKGRSLQVVLPIDYSDGADAIVATAAVTRVTQLKGMKVAFNPLSPSAFLLAYALQQNGLAPDAIEPVSMTPDDVPSAMLGHSIKVGVTYEPSVPRILAHGEGFHVLYSSHQAPGLITDVLTFRKAYIAAHRAQVVAMGRAFVKGLDYMQAHPHEADRIIAHTLRISPKEVVAQLKGVKNPPLAAMPASFARGSTSLYTSGHVISEVLVRKKEISAQPDLAATMDPGIVADLAH